MALQTYDLSPVDTPGHDSQFTMHSKHIANVIELYSDGGTFDLGTASGGTVALARAPVQKVVLGANSTFTLPGTAVAGDRYLVTIYQDATGGRVATWPAGFKWPNGIAGILTITASAYDVLSVFYDGTNWQAVLNKAFG